MKFELDRLTFDEFCEDYEIQSPLSLFSEKDNGGFIFSLFGKEYSDKLLEISYQTIKDDVGELYHLYNQNQNLDLWTDKFEEISSKFLFDNKYQLVNDNLFDLFIAKNFWNKGSRFYSNILTLLEQTFP